MAKKNLEEKTISKRNAKELLIKDIKGKICAEVLWGIGTGASLFLLMAPSSRFDNYTSIGLGAICAGTAIYKTKQVFNRIREYLDNPEKYIEYYHNTKIKEK